MLEGLFRRVYPCLSCRRGIRAPSCTRCAITLAWHIPVIVVRFGRHGAFYLWQVWWSAQAGRKGRHELCSSQPYKPPSDARILPLRGADCNALRRTMSFMGGGAPKKAAGKNEKYINTQLAAVVLELKEP